MISLAVDEARRIALAAQGFDRPRPKRVTFDHLRRIIRQLGLLQIDLVTVVVPAQYQVLFSRLGPYDRSKLDDLVYRRREFTEQWAHEASIVPVEHWPLLQYRRDTHRVRPWGFESFLAKHAAYADWVLAEVHSRGPLRADSLPLPDGASARIPGAWVGTVRAVLEAHFGRGAVCIADRGPAFARVFDIAERIIPAEHYRRVMHPVDAQRELLRQAARAHGVGTAADLADYYRMPVRDARPRLNELVESGALCPVRVEGWREQAFLSTEAAPPAALHAAALLSPFDPLIWFRPRTQRLFAFEHRFEIFVPAEKRRWGCYVLPFLFGERLAARVDLKAERATNELLVLAAHAETGIDTAVVASGLAAELRTLAGWLGLEKVVSRSTGAFARRLSAELRACRHG